MVKFAGVPRGPRPSSAPWSAFWVAFGHLARSASNSAFCVLVGAFWAPKSAKKHPKKHSLGHSPKALKKHSVGHFPARAPGHSCKWRPGFAIPVWLVSSLDLRHDSSKSGTSRPVCRASLARAFMGERPIPSQQEKIDAHSFVSGPEVGIQCTLHMRQNFWAPPIWIR